MPSLSELQRRFAAAVLDPAREPDERMAVYRHTIFANYRNALGATYRVVRELTGKPFFDTAVDAFVVAHPSTGGDLNVYGDAFPAFLAHLPACGAIAVPSGCGAARMGDGRGASRCRRRRRRASHAVGTRHDSGGRRRAATIHVSIRRAGCCARRSPCCASGRRTRTRRSGDLPIEFGAGDDYLLVRREGGRVVVERVGAGDFAWLAALAAGADLAHALDAAFDADATFDLGTALRTYILNGTLTGIVAGD